MLFIFILLAISAILASGVLFSHQRSLTFLAAAGALFEAKWLLLTLIDRLILPNVSSQSVFLVGAVITLIIWLTQIKKWHLPYNTIGSGRRDIPVIILTVIVALGALLIMNANSFTGLELTLHGFFNGDTTTFITLTQRSQATNTLLSANPFAGGGALEYPTLLHAGFATAWQFTNQGLNWLHFLPLMTYVQILITIPLFFLLFDMINPEPEEKHKLWYGIKSRWVVLISQTAIIGYILTLSWDHFVYPQSHFFLLNILLLLAALLQKSLSLTKTAQCLPVTIAFVTAIILLFSNAVTGTIALTMTAVFFLLRANDKKRSIAERVTYLVGIPVLALLFLLFTPGEPSFGLPNFSYTAAQDMLRLAPILLLSGTAIFFALGRHNFLVGTVTALFGLAFFTFIFSTRNIVIDNASRFFYYGILFSTPFLLHPLIRLYYFLKREIINTTRTFSEQLFSYVLILISLSLFLLPAGASVASTYDNLLFKDEQTITIADRLALEWLSANTSPEAVILASPNEPWAVPLFTGRSLLRTNYWLSPHDDLEETVNKALAGDQSAQAEAIKAADYLYLSFEEKELWQTLPANEVYNSNNHVIYTLK